MTDPEPRASDVGAVQERLGIALDTALARYRKRHGPISLLFSGGLDSGLLAWELRREPGLQLVTIGVAGSADLDAADSAARELSLPWAPAYVTRDDVSASLASLDPELSTIAPPMRGIFVALDLAVAHSALEGPVLCGQGSDELFLGYAHFRGLANDEAEERAETDLTHLLEEDWPRTQRIATRRGRAIEAPYLDPEWVAAARAIPIEMRRPGPEAKTVLREFARSRGLPEAIARRAKRAIQYGSGIDRLLRQNAFASTEAGAH